MTENRYIIYGTLECRFCCMAIDLCKATSHKYIFLDCEGREDILKEYKEFYEHKTVPIILANNVVTGRTEMIGGYTEMLDHIKEGSV